MRGHWFALQANQWFFAFAPLNIWLLVIPLDHSYNIYNSHRLSCSLQVGGKAKVRTNPPSHPLVNNYANELDAPLTAPKMTAQQIIRRQQMVNQNSQQSSSLRNTTPKPVPPVEDMASGKIELLFFLMWNFEVKIAYSSGVAFLVSHAVSFKAIGLQSWVNFTVFVVKIYWPFYVLWSIGLLYVHITIVYVHPCIF